MYNKMLVFSQSVLASALRHQHKGSQQGEPAGEGTEHCVPEISCSQEQADNLNHQGFDQGFNKKVWVWRADQISITHTHLLTDNWLVEVGGGYSESRG